MSRDHLVALLEALFVTFLWSSSYVLVKVGLTEMSPLSLVALRYMVASLILLPLALRKGEGEFLRDSRNVVKMAVLGVVALKEYPRLHQLAGMGLVLVGAYMYFNAPLGGNSLLGVGITLVSGIGWGSYQ